MRPHDRQINNDFVNRRRLRDMAQDERLTLILEEHLGEDAWREWADFCQEYPEFRYFSRGLDHLTLSIGREEIPSTALINIFEYVKMASITLNPNDQFDIASDYTKLSSLNQISIYNVENPVEFVRSTQINELLVSSSVNTPSYYDLVLPILRISERITDFRYMGGSLTYASIFYLSWNPIETLWLENINITDNYAFIQFLSDAPLLIYLFLTGYGNLDTQECFFHKSNRSRPKMKVLRISFHERLLTEYARIVECTDLINLGLHYTCSDGIEDLFKILFLVPNLKTIDLFPKYPQVDKECNNREQSMIESYKLRFMRRGISLHNHGPTF